MVANRDAEGLVTSGRKHMAGAAVSLPTRHDRRRSPPRRCARRLSGITALSVNELAAAAEAPAWASVPKEEMPYARPVFIISTTRRRVSVKVDGCCWGGGYRGY